MAQPLLHLGGESEQALMHLAPANGFVPQTYLPVLRHLQGYHHVSFPPRALWGDPQAPMLDASASWTSLADDLLAGFKQYGLSDVIAIGHSFGGIATLLALLQEPHHFKAVIVLDPTILTPEICAGIRQARASGVNEHPMAQGALRRRRIFDNIKDAYERFHGRGAFVNWDDECLQRYVEYGTYPCEDNKRCLTWSPEWEAYYFSTAYSEIWEDLPKLADISVPMLFIAGGNSDTYLPQSAERVREIVPSATHITLDGHGHLFPQTAPQQTASLIDAWLRQ